MKFFAMTLFALVEIASARQITLKDVIDIEKNTTYGYITKIRMPLVEKLRKAEEEASRVPSRMIGGSLAGIGQFLYQSSGTSLASATLVSPTRILTAAHNLNDGILLTTRVNVVLDSTTIFTGIRLVSSLPSPCRSSGSQLDEDFAGNVTIASGYGLTSFPGGISANQALSFVHLPVIKNKECIGYYGDTFVQPSSGCTSSEGNKNICTGDSGGPLAVTRNDSPLLIGITSFRPGGGCDASEPAAFVSVTSVFYKIINSIVNKQ